MKMTKRMIWIIGVLMALVIPIPQAINAQPVSKYYSRHQFVQVTNLKTVTYSNFKWNTRVQTSSLKGQSLLAKGYYKVGTKTFLTVYDQTGKWRGYINQSDTKISSTYTRMQNILNKYKNDRNVSIYYEGLTKNNFAVAGARPDSSMYAASVAKLPVEAFVQNQIRSGKLKSSQKFKYNGAANNVPSAMVSGGTGILQYKNHQASYSVQQLLTWTSTKSDNQASNQLLYYVCYAHKNEFRYFIKNVYGANSYTKYLSAKQAAQVLQTIYYQGGQVISDLRHTDWAKNKIGALNVPVAHKIGINGSYNHDAAIVYGQRPFELVIMSNGWSDQKISNLARQIYNAN